MELIQAIILSEIFILLTGVFEEFLTGRNDQKRLN